MTKLDMAVSSIIKQHPGLEAVPWHRDNYFLRAKSNEK